MTQRFGRLGSLAAALLLVTVGQGQAQPAAGVQAAGIPIENATVRTTCGGCHTPDERGRMSRISYQRNTPEGWQDTIKRMMALNGLRMDPAAGREIVRYLSNELGLAPEEARPVAYEVEKRLVDEKNVAPELQGVCNACHSTGRVLSQRRSREEWELLVSMHRGWYPLVDRQVFRRMGPAPRDRSADGRPPDTRHPHEKAVDYLARTYPLVTPEWERWSAAQRPARLGGEWFLTAHEPGKGPAFGRMTLTPVAGSDDEFTSEVTFTYARTGEQVRRTGRVTIYTGFQWRGRSSASPEGDAFREVMFVDRDQRRIEGRWFTGGYDETGMDVTLTRATGDMTLLGTDRAGLRRGATGLAVRVFAANLPDGVQARDLDFGAGVTVTQVAVTGGVVTATVSVAADAPVGPRDVSLRGSVRPGAAVVYDRIDSVRVTPEWNMARTGGVSFPKRLAQFEAVAYANGPDRRPGTDDDLRIDVVEAQWSLAEYTATLNDDDVKFVGKINESTGLFTPNAEGPNPQRSGERNNIGDVWVVAVVSEGGQVVRGRAHLLVSPPVYMRFDPTVTP